mgnify:CR=1 FL=1
MSGNIEVTVDEFFSFTEDEQLMCIPPRDMLNFGEYTIPKDYRESLYMKHPKYTLEEILGTYLGYNPNFPSISDYDSNSESDSEEDCFFDDNPES